jgi:serine/threonine protein kinase
MADSPLLNNRYQLQQPLGNGGMAVVYRARDTRLARVVALKVLRQNLSNDVTFRQQFHQEAKAAANLTHPNIVTIYDFGLDNGRLFIVMEWVPGTDLKTLMRQRGRFSVDETIHLMVQACAGIGYAHRAGLVHCDIKPQNMLVTPDLRLKVTDFGSSRALATIRPGEKNTIVWGSPHYFSPEQASGTAPSPASDVYSLGVVMYELLTGQLPFNAEDVNELANLHREARPLSPRRLNPSIPPALEEVIMKVLSKEPSARYRTADQLGRVLLTFFKAASPSAVAVNPSAPALAFAPVPADGAPQADAAGEDALLDIDWVTIGLGLLAFIAVGGLVPFWLYVWFSLNPPVR